MLMYGVWNPNTFVDGSVPPNDLGSLVSVWCDNPNAQTEDQIATALYSRLRVMSQLTWGSPKPLLYRSFLSAVNATGQAPA
jgi:hexosaminidase